MSSDAEVPAVGSVLDELPGYPLLGRRLVRQARGVALDLLEDAQQVAADELLYVGGRPPAVPRQLGQQQRVARDVGQLRRWAESDGRVSLNFLCLDD